MRWCSRQAPSNCRLLCVVLFTCAVSFLLTTCEAKRYDCPHSTDKESEAVRGQVAWAVAHSWRVAAFLTSVLLGLAGGEASPTDQSQ